MITDGKAKVECRRFRLIGRNRAEHVSYNPNGNQLRLLYHVLVENDAQSLWSWKPTTAGPIKLRVHLAHLECTDLAIEFTENLQDYRIRCVLKN